MFGIGSGTGARRAGFKVRTRICMFQELTVVSIGDVEWWWIVVLKEWVGVGVRPLSCRCGEAGEVWLS